jgi:hypothetical protein
MSEIYECLFNTSEVYTLAISNGLFFKVKYIWETKVMLKKPVDKPKLNS